MTFAAIADIHGNLLALEAVLADIARRGISEIVNLGDLVSGPLWPGKTADRLIGLHMPSIAGNHERQLLTLPREAMGPSDRYTIDQLSPAQLAYLSTLPKTLIYQGALLCHGTPDSDLAYFLHEVGPEGACPASSAHIEKHSPEAALTLCGHTHIPGQVRLADGRRIVNPGSVGLPAYTDDSPYPHAMEAGTPEARYAILTESTVEFIAIGYDHESAARQAVRNRRPDWAIALRTGKIAVSG